MASLSLKKPSPFPVSSYKSSMASFMDDWMLRGISDKDGL